MMKTTCLLQTLACLASAVVPAGLHGQELLTNGNFEGATLAPWAVSAPAGTSVATFNENSPYLTRYPAGTKSVRFQDDDVEFETPFFGQSFAPQSGIDFSFDFKVPDTTPGSSWYLIWKGEDNTTAFFFSIGGQDGASINLNQTTISSLEPNLWYHIQGTARAPGQTVTGSVLNSRGEQKTFTGGFPFGVQSVLNGLTVTDGDQARNEPILIDNISAAPAALASASMSIGRGPNGQVTVSWTVGGYSLQARGAIGSGAEWTNVPTTGQSYTTSADQPVQFFRLISN